MKLSNNLKVPFMVLILTTAVIAGSLCIDQTGCSNPQLDQWIIDARQTMDQDLLEE